MNKKIFLFDYDGTIADSLNAVFKAFKKISKKFGMKESTLGDFVGMYTEGFYEGVVAMGLAEERIEEFIREFKMPLTENHYGLFRGIRSVIQQLSKNGDVYVISSNLTEVVEHSIKKNKIEGIKMVIGGDIERSKVKKINKIKSEKNRADIYYIGDTIGDIKEAKKAGVKSVAVTWGYHTKDILEKENPDFIFERPKDLLNLI